MGATLFSILAVASLLAAPVLGYLGRWRAAGILLALLVVFPTIVLRAQLTSPAPDGSDQQMGWLFDWMAGALLVIVSVEFSIGSLLRHYKFRSGKRLVGDVSE